VRSNMERELIQRVKAKVKDQVMDALIEANPVELPAGLLAEEIGSLKGQTRQNLGGNAMELPDELFADSAARRVKLGLVIAEAIKVHGLSPKPERVRELVEEMAATYEQPQEVLDYYYSDPQRLASVNALALEELVVERMLETAEVVDTETTFAALTEDGGA
jgi:trigger factor